MNQNTNTQKIQLLTWKLKDQLFAAELTHCLEVQQGMKLLKVPHSKNYISGITNFRGDVITVLDLEVMLGQSGKPNISKPVTIRFKYNDKQIAILADSISEVIEISYDKLEPANIHLTEYELQFISHVCYTNYGVILILNINELFVVR